MHLVGFSFIKCMPLTGFLITGHSKWTLHILRFASLYDFHICHMNSTYWNPASGCILTSIQIFKIVISHQCLFIICIGIYIEKTHCLTYIYLESWFSVDVSLPISSSLPTPSHIELELFLQLLVVVETFTAVDIQSLIPFFVCFLYFCMFAVLCSSL